MASYSSKYSVIVGKLESLEVDTAALRQQLATVNSRAAEAEGRCRSLELTVLSHEAAALEVR